MGKETTRKKRKVTTAESSYQLNNTKKRPINKQNVESSESDPASERNEASDGDLSDSNDEMLEQEDDDFSDSDHSDDSSGSLEDGVYEDFREKACDDVDKTNPSKGDATNSRNNEIEKMKSEKVLTEKSLLKFKEKQERKGVIYISRISVGLDPQKIRHLMEKHGKVNRIYLTLESAEVRARRKAAGGSKNKRFVDGWVEFEDKNVAKMVASVLNNNPIGGPKRRRYSQDLWNIKYLSGFKWNHLTERLAHEKRIRDLKLRLRLQQAKRENQAYLESVEKAKQVNGIIERKKRKGHVKESSSEREFDLIKSKFKQRSAIDKKLSSY